MVPQRPNPEELFDAVWAYILKLIRREVEATNQTRVAKILHVKPSTIGRWLRGDRGQSVTLSYAMNVLATLKGDFLEMAQEIGYKDAARMLQVAKDNPVLIQKFLAILESDSPESQKIKTEIDYLFEKIEKPSE